MNEKYGIGQSVSRFEDPRLLRGEGRFINDMVVPGMAHIAYVRSPHARARIVSVDPAAALAAPGVLGVFTIDDLERDGIGTTAPTLKRSRPDGKPMFWRAHPGLAKAMVRHVGDPVAIVAAETLAQAKDAAERVAVEYEALPVTDPVWDDCPDNISNVFEVGDRAATDAAFAAAAHVVKRRYTVSRVHAQFMEPRGALGEWDRGRGRYTLHCDVQYPHRVREILAGVLKVARTAGPRRQPRRRRRIRRQGLGAPRAPARAVARAQARPPGEVDLRPQRGAARGRARARRRRRDRARVRRRATGSSRCARTTPARSAPTSPPTATCCPASPTSVRWRACT